MSDDIEYRVEVQNESTGEWYPYDGTLQLTIEKAERKLARVREYYTDKTKPLRIASAPKQVWTPVPTKLELAVERVQAALAARDYPDMSAISRYDGKPLLAADIRLLLNTVKEMRQ